MFFKLCKIFFLYGLTAPTNVMCLGAFTECWLHEAVLTRFEFSNSYLFATMGVFFVLQGQNYFFKSLSLKICFWTLAVVFMIFSCGRFISLYSFFIFFFLIQYIGQGLIVGECRVLLAYTAQRYSLCAGCLEAWGTLLVYVLPFIFLYALKTHSWQLVIAILGFIYASIACFLAKTPSRPVVTKTVLNVWRNKYFLIVNSIIYLPVLLTSGFFFHLEAFVERYRLSFNVLECCILPQVCISILFQIIVGFFVKDEKKRIISMFYLLLISQIIWLSSLFFIQGNLFCWIYTLSGAIGWGCFGLLVNITWRYLFEKEDLWTEACLRNSVNFGFLANAMGPLLFALFF